MSQYATIEGWYWFNSETEYQEALEEYGSLMEDFEREEIVPEGVLVKLPFDHYRNLHRYVGDIGAYADMYHVVSATMDGALEGWINEGQSEVAVDLIQWAITSEYTFGIETPDEHLDTETQQEIINTFLEDTYTEEDLESLKEN